MHPTHAGQRSAGQGQSVCPNCNGSGKSSALDTSSEQSASSNNPLFIALAFIIAWCVLFYFTLMMDIYLIEMVFGKEEKSPEFLKWLNILLVAIPPTFIVYKFRKLIPGLLAVSIVGGILAIFVFAVISKM